MISTDWRRTPGCAGLCGRRRRTGGAGGSGGPRRGAGDGSGRARCPRRMRRAGGLRVSRRRRGGAAASRTGVHPGREPRRRRPVAGERRASADGPGAASGGAGDARHGRYAHRDAKARSALLLQALQGLSAAQHLVGRVGPDRAFGVPRRQRAGGARFANQRYLSPYRLPRSQRRPYHQSRPQRYWPRTRERVRHALPQMASAALICGALAPRGLRHQGRAKEIAHGGGLCRNRGPEGFVTRSVWPLLTLEATVFGYKKMPTLARATALATAIIALLDEFICGCLPPFFALAFPVAATLPN